MKQQERVHRIEKLLRAQPRNKQELLSELDISNATLKRDFDFMRDRLHVPISYDKYIAKYRIQSNEINPKLYAMPGLWFSESEIQALLTLEHLINNIQLDSLLKHHTQALHNKLEQLLGQSSTLDEVKRRVVLVGIAKRKMKLAHFETIGFALLKRQQIQVSYQARSYDQMSQRTLSPQRLMYYRENWYLEAWCHMRLALRSFSVDAVRSVELIDTPCHEVPMDVVQQTFGPGYGIFAGDCVQWAQLRFSANRARWVAHEQWHPEQHGDFDNDGRYLLNIPFTDHRELMMDILKYGAECEVLEPLELRQRVADEINTMKNMY